MTNHPRRPSSRKHVPFNGRPSRRLYVPHRSRHVPESEWQRKYSVSIPPKWQDIARSTGFDIVGRVRDRYHVVLRCQHCGADTVQKAYVLRTAQPMCGACLERQHKDDASKCGYRFLGRDNDHHKYGRYRLPCGHIVRMQFGRVATLAREGRIAGKPGYHCPQCYDAKLKSDAAFRGWALVGPDPENKHAYRLYRHNACGHEQRIAVVNMITGRFGCERCGETWSAAPSFIYVMQFTVPGKGRFVKVGYSRDPDSRLLYQLAIPDSVSASIVHRVNMPTGHAAQKAEKRLHNQLQHHFPDCVVARDELAGWINVTSEVYRSGILPEILKRLQAIAERYGPDQNGRGSGKH